MLIIQQQTRRDFLSWLSGKLALGAAALATLPALGGRAAASGADSSRSTKRWRSRIETGRSPESYAVAADPRGVVYEGAYGKRDMAGPRRHDARHGVLAAVHDEGHHCYSCMQLVEQGRLSLEQPMSQILPELGAAMVLEGFDASGKPRLRPAKRAITLRHLLTHTSGSRTRTGSDRNPQYERRPECPISPEAGTARSRRRMNRPREALAVGIGMDVVARSSRPSAASRSRSISGSTSLSPWAWRTPAS